ncbi:MAG TPA: FAD-dependent oxidoreductase [Pirellulales bacterium]|nr:FAD-dependent oxidoreductase [Pirellulales bacterium]
MAQPEVWDVIVVGGGFAGVTAARDASHRDLRTLLLEARDRLGGRTANADFGGHRIEVGGTWIGCAQPHVWAERTRYQTPIAESAALQSNTQYVWVADGERHVGGADDYWAALSPAYDAFYAPARAAFPQPYDPLLVKSVEGLDRLNAAQAIETLKVSPPQRELLRSLAAVCGHSPSNTSSYLDQLRWIALSGFSNNFMWDNLGRFRLKGARKASSAP